MDQFLGHPLPHIWLHGLHITSQGGCKSQSSKCCFTQGCHEVPITTCPTWARWCDGLLAALREFNQATHQPGLHCVWDSLLAMSWVPNVCAYHGQSGKTCRVFVWFFGEKEVRNRQNMLWSGTAAFCKTLLIHVLPCWWRYLTWIIQYKQNCPAKACKPAVISVWTTTLRMEATALALAWHAMADCGE